MGGDKNEETFSQRRTGVGYERGSGVLSAGCCTGGSIVFPLYRFNKWKYRAVFVYVLVRLSGYTTCNGSSSITLTGYYIGSTFTGIQNGGSYAGGPAGGGTAYDISGLSGYNVFIRAESTHNVPGYSGNLSIQIVDP